MEDAELWHAFTTQRLTHAEWDHRAHVRTAFLHLADVGFDLDEAHLRMRAGIIRLNERHGLVETSRRGYFETLTRAWLCLVGEAARRSGASSTAELLEHCPELLSRDLATRHYSPEALTSVRARAMFIPPDREPLPFADG